nr:hypothetical protein [Tanacetum cinerariifolium]
MMVQAVEEVGDLPTIVQDTPILDAPSSSQPHIKHKPRRKERKETEMKSYHKAKIAELESRVEKLEEENRKIADIDVDAEVNLENVIDVDGKAVVEEMVEVITNAKIIVDEVSTASGQLNAANEEPVGAAPTNITTAQPSEATKINVNITTAPNAKGIVFHDMKESSTRTASSKSQVKNKSKAKIEAGWNADMKDNIDWNEVFEQVQSRQSNVGMSYEDIRPLFKEEYNKVQTLFKEGLEIDAERIIAPRKRIRKEKVEKDQTAKKQKGDKLKHDNIEKQKQEEQQEAKELKRNFEIVPDDEDDVFVNVTSLSSKPPTIVDYKIYKE